MNKKQSGNWFKEHPVLTGIFGLAIVVLFLMVVGNNASNSTPQSTSTQIGEQGVYDSIDATSDCEALQNAFNIAMDNVERRQPGDELRKISLSYANYANDRMRSLSC